MPRAKSMMRVKVEFRDKKKLEFDMPIPSSRDLKQAIKDGLAADERGALLGLAKVCAAAEAGLNKKGQPYDPQKSIRSLYCLGVCI
jgi:hypothetical protein